MPTLFLCRDCHNFLSLRVSCTEQGLKRWCQENFGKRGEKAVWPHPPANSISSTSSGFWNLNGREGSAVGCPQLPFQNRRLEEGRKEEDGVRWEMNKQRRERSLPGARGGCQQTERCWICPEKKGQAREGPDMVSELPESNSSCHTPYSSGFQNGVRDVWKGSGEEKKASLSI